MVGQLPIEDLKIFINGLASSANEDDLKQVFSKFGIVTEVLIPRDVATKRGKGYAFVSFENSSECDEACKEMNGKELEGNTIQVARALQKRTDRFHHDVGQGGGGTRSRGGRGGGRSSRPFSHGFYSGPDRRSHPGNSRDYPSGGDRFRRSDEYSQRSETRQATRYVTDQYRSRHSPIPRNFGYREGSPDGRTRASDQYDSRAAYRRDPPTLMEEHRFSPSYDDGFAGGSFRGRTFDTKRERRIPTRDYGDRRPMSHDQYSNPNYMTSHQRSYDQMSRQPRDYSGRHSPIQMSFSRVSPGATYPHNMRQDEPRFDRSREDSRRRRSPSPPAKRMRIEEPGYSGPVRMSHESRAREPMAMPHDRMREGAPDGRKRMHLPSPPERRMRFEQPGRDDRFSGRGRNASFQDRY